MKTTNAKIFIFALIFIWVDVTVYTKIPRKEGDALKALFNNTGGSHWWNKKNWKGTPGTENTWNGIICDEDNSTVLKVELAGNNLRGKLPADLEALANMTTLDLSNNHLTGDIPGWIGNLTALRKLDLSGNRFEGPIPFWIGKLEKLEELILDNNMLGGSMPSTLGSLAKLKVLKIGGNRLTGEIPSTLKRLESLDNNRSNFAWNGLYTNDVDLKDFLNRKQVGQNWENTQTVPPLNIKIVDYKQDSITIGWQPIKYTEGTGGYRVFYREEKKSGSKELVKETAGKNDSKITLEKLRKTTGYRFKIQSWTERHSKNDNTIDSVFSKEFTAFTRGILISGKIMTYEDVKKTRKVPLPDVNIVAFEKGGKAITDTTVTGTDGRYLLNVTSGWTGSITPSKPGYKFENVVSIYQPVKTDIDSQDFTAEATTVISGKVIYKKEKKEVNKKGKKDEYVGVDGVEIIFADKKGKTSQEKTDKDGVYDHIVPYNWSGTATPQKTGHEFEPGQKEYKAVTSHIKGEDYAISLKEISGRVTGKRRKGIPGVELVFSGVDTETLSYLIDKEKGTAFVTTNKYGNYTYDLPGNWSGNVIPVSPGKQKIKYIFYPSSKNNLTLEKEETISPINFQAEPDFKFFFLLKANSMYPSEDIFRDVYGDIIFYPEIIAGYKFYRNFYIWGGGSFLSKKGTTFPLADTSRWLQADLSLGFGYHGNISLYWAWNLRLAGVLINYSDEAYNEKVSQHTWGARGQLSVNYKITDRWFSEFSIGYMYAKDTFGVIPLSLEGIKAGIGIGYKFY